MKDAKLAFERLLEVHNNGPNYRDLTGINAVAQFESSESVHTDFSKLCGEGRKTSGMVEMVASTILDLEYCCEELDPWDRNDVSRSAWISNIESILKSYENGRNFILGPKSKTSGDDIASPSPAKRQRRSLDSISSPKESISSSTLAQVMNVLKVCKFRLLCLQCSSSLSHFFFICFCSSCSKVPLLELEQRIFAFSGLERAVREADEADDNGSVDSTEMKEISEEQRALDRAEKIELGWKKKINSLKRIPTKRAGAIRDVLIAAIGIARKGNLDEVLVDLRSALNLHRPGAAGKARQTALAVLEKYGGCDDDGDEDEGDKDDDELSTVDDDNNDEKTSEEGESFLCTEGMMIFGCLDGNEFADRVDWKEAVNDCKTLSR